RHAPQSAAGGVSVRRAKRLPLEGLAPYLLEVPEQSRTGCWAEVFGNQHPVEIEIGFCKRLFLLTSSQARTDTNFVGIEIDRKYQLFTATRLAKRAVSNVKLVCADARKFLVEHIEPASVQAIHVYFPDPWWKKRHHKRRLFTPEFAAECARALRPGGRLHFVTDVEDYFHMATGLLAAHPILRPLPPPEPGGPRHDLDYLTNFERKCGKESRPIWRACYEKQTPP